MTKSRTRKKHSLRWPALVLVGLVLLGVIQMAGRIDRLIDMNEQVAAARLQLAQAQAVYEAKLATIELLDNPSYLERVARENLGMVKEGETIVSVVRTTAASAFPDAFDASDASDASDAAEISDAADISDAAAAASDAFDVAELAEGQN